MNATGLPTAFFIALMACAAQAARAQLTASMRVQRNAAAHDGPIEVTLSRPLAKDEGELVLMIGGVDVTAISERSDSRIRFEPSSLSLPRDNAEVVVFRRSGSRWTEIKRFALGAMQATTAPAIVTAKSATVGNKGQLAEGRAGGFPAPDRRTFQDFVINAGLRASRDGPTWSFTSQSNYIGVSRREDALRFGVRGKSAPMLDLSDYVIGLRASNTTLSLGQVSFGTSRHLANGFAARGTTLSWAHGPTTMTIGALAGSAQVGWSDPTGLERASNRMFGAMLGREIAPSHPGALRLDVTLLDGSKQPVASFTQGAIVDAEESAGGTVQLSAALPSQRLRVASGYSRSRFENPRRDSELVGNAGIKRPAPTTRGALFVEGSAGVLQNATSLFGVHAPTNLAVGVRHQRIDPLYRSIAAATAADRQESVADATMSVGAVVAQLSQNWNHDNLGDVASVLTTNGRAATASLAVPVGAIGGARRHQAFFPTFTVALNRTHQFANKLPTNGSFRDQDLPNQVSLVGDAAAMWQAGRVRLTLHANRSAQDNRQALRETADFESGVSAISLGTALGSRGDVALDVGKEFQTAKERNETTRVRRYTINTNFRPWTNTGLLGAFSLLHTRPPTGGSSVNSDQRVEVSENLWNGTAGSRGQLFVRYARTTSILPDLTLLSIVRDRIQRQQWTIATGLNLRLF